MIWADYLVIVLAVLLIVVVLLQNSDGDAASAFSGEKSELFKNKKDRGFELFLTRATLAITTLLIVFVVLSNLLEH